MRTDRQYLEKAYEAERTRLNHVDTKGRDINPFAWEGARGSDRLLLLYIAKNLTPEEVTNE